MGRIVFGAAQEALDALGLGAVRPPAVCAIDSTFRASDTSCVAIGLSGDVIGVLVVSFCPPEAAGIAGELAQEPIEAHDEEGIRCAMAELANMIAGYAATEFGEDGLNVYITPPTAITGPEIHLDFPRDADNGMETFELNAGNFGLIVSLRTKDATSPDGGRATDPQRFRLLRG